jgi:hypothetical protein
MKHEVYTGTLNDEPYTYLQKLICNYHHGIDLAAIELIQQFPAVTELQGLSLSSQKPAIGTYLSQLNQFTSL